MMRIKKKVSASASPDGEKVKETGEEEEEDVVGTRNIASVGAKNLLPEEDEMGGCSPS